LSREIGFSASQFDQKLLSKVGGYIALKKDKPMFKFDTTEQYSKYMELKKAK
jgi:hypothetical protein